MKLVAVGIITHDGRVLACQRKPNGAYPLKWEFPGGKIENGEAPEAALVRELREELGIDAVIDREFHRQEWVYPNDEAGPMRDDAYRVFYFLVQSYKGEPVNHAFHQIKWVSPGELEGMDVLEGNREAVKLIARDVKEQ
jgi:8-oxo-dGTP diphosphatase